MARNRRHRYVLFLCILIAINLSFLEGLTEEESKAVHHGYTKVDRLLECVHRILDKTAVRALGVRSLNMDSYPTTREELFSILEKNDLRLFETEEWAYLIMSDHFKPGILPGGRVPSWKRIRIVSRINPLKRGGIYG